MQIHALGTSFRSFLTGEKNWAHLAMRPKSIIPSSKAAGAVTLSVLSYPICPQDTVKCLTLAWRDRIFEQESQIDVFEGQPTLRRAPAKAAHPSRGMCCRVVTRSSGAGSKSMSAFKAFPVSVSIRELLSWFVYFEWWFFFKTYLS